MLLARDVHDPGIGFVTLTRVQVTPDLQQARVFYTALGDDKARASTRARARPRAAPFLRRQIGARLRLRRVPELGSSTTSRSPARTGSSSCSTSIRAGGQPAP